MVRFLLTFDDGPSALSTANPTQKILDTLASNPLQSDIKAVFFVQTRDPRAGGSDLGRKLMQRMHAEGHVLALHSGTPRGHINHTLMSLNELDDSLRHGRGDIAHITGQAPLYIRPPYWSYNLATLERYNRYGLRMLLDDIAVADGKIYGYSSNSRIADVVRAELTRVAEAIQFAALEAVEGVYPIVVTLHDINSSTARDLPEYLRSLVEEAQQLGLQPTARPFYDERSEIESTLTQRALDAPPTHSAWMPARHLMR